MNKEQIADKISCSMPFSVDGPYIKVVDIEKLAALLEKIIIAIEGSAGKFPKVDYTKGNDVY